MIIKLAIAEVTDASQGQKQLIAAKEEQDQVVHVSRPDQGGRMKPPIRIIDGIR